MSTCPFCHPTLDPHQTIIAENDSCYFLMPDHEQDVLVGSGVIVPKAHRATTFDLTPLEWQHTYEILHQAKEHLDQAFQPDGYTLGWNVGTASNQAVPHAGKGLRHWLKRPE